MSPRRLLLEFLQQPMWSLRERSVHTELSPNLDQIGLSLADGGERLVEIGRRPHQIVTLRRLCRQSEGHPGLVNIFQCLLDLHFGDQQRCLVSVVIRARDRSLWKQFLGPSEIGLGFLKRRLFGFQDRDVGSQRGDLVANVLHGVLEFPSHATALRLQGAAPETGRLSGPFGPPPPRPS